MNYILNEQGEPVAEPDLIKWATWFERAKRHVADETNDAAGSRVSTVFLGLDYGFHTGLPILWETMVFGGRLNGEQTRCGGSREQAQAMHAAMVARVKATLTNT